MAGGRGVAVELGGTGDGVAAGGVGEAGTGVAAGAGTGGESLPPPTTTIGSDCWSCDVGLADAAPAEAGVVAAPGDAVCAGVTELPTDAIVGGAAFAIGLAEVTGVSATDVPVQPAASKTDDNTAKSNTVIASADRLLAAGRPLPGAAGRVTDDGWRVSGREVTSDAYSLALGTSAGCEAQLRSGPRREEWLAPGSRVRQAG